MMDDEWTIAGSTTCLVAVDVHLNGSGPYTFFVDSGWVSVNVSQPVAEALSLPVDDLSCAVVNRLAVGTLSLPDYQIAVRDNAACTMDLGPGRRLDGFLGMSLLRYYRTTIDYRAGRIGLGSAMHSLRCTMYRPEPGFSYTRTKYANLYLVVPVRLNGHGPYDFLLDTGAQVTSVMPELARDLGLPHGEPGTAYGIQGAADRRSVHWSEAASIAVGTACQEHLPIVVADMGQASQATGMGIDGYLGHNFLEKYTVRFSVLDLVLGLKRHQEA